MAEIRKPIFLRPLDLGTIVSGNARLGHAVHHLGRPGDIGLTWKTDGNGNLWARGDLGSAYTVDFCAMISANAQPGTNIRLRLGDTQGDVDGGSAPYDSGALDFIDPAITREDGLYHSHHELPAIQTARWWRIDITGHTGDFEAGALVLGRKIELSRFYNLDFEFGIEDLGDGELTPFGVFDEEPGIFIRTIDFTLDWLTEAEFEGKMRPLIEAVGKRKIVYCCFDPQPTPYRQARTYMGRFEKPPYARGRRKPRTLGMEIKILSVI